MMIFARIQVMKLRLCETWRFNRTHMITTPKIRYAQCWEDPRTVNDALAVTSEDDIISIASGGDNTFALLLNNPRSLTAIESNPSQIFLVELKMRAIQKLDYADFIGFVGARPCDRRSQLFLYLRPYLSDQVRAYWDRHPGSVLNGIIHSGKFEKYFSTFRKYVLPLIHDRKTVESLLTFRSPDEQRSFYDEVWDNKRWQGLFRVFFGEFLLGRLGRDPSFFRYVNVRNVADELVKRTRHGLTEVPIQQNFFVEYIFTGQYRDLETAHPYLRESHFQYLKENVARINLVHASLDQYLSKLPVRSISKFNLSDIFEYVSDESFALTLQEILRVCRDGGRIAFWTLFVPRSPSVVFSDRVAMCASLSRNLFRSARTFFYGSFAVWKVTGCNGVNQDVLAFNDLTSKHLNT